MAGDEPIALKSVLDIVVNDAQFQQYYQKFQQYQASLAQMPTAWQQVGAQAQGTALTFEKMGALMLTQTEMLRRIAEHYGGLTLQSTKQETLWKRLTEHAKGFAGHVAGATRSILHWGTLTTAFTGLLGAGGLWGIHRLAAEGATAGRTSMGLGLSLGQMQAFRTSFGQLLGDPMGFLSGLSEARADPSKRVVLNQLRQSGTDPGAVLDAVRQMAQRWSPQMYGTMLGAYHLDQLGLTVEDIRRLHDMTREEYQLYRQRYQQDIKQMELTSDQQVRLRRLTQTFESAGSIIRTSFWEKVAQLGPGLERLSAQVTKLVSAFLRSPIIGHVIEIVSNYLERLAKELEGVTDTDINKWLKEWMDRGTQAVEWFKWFTRELGNIRSTIETKGWFYFLTHGPDAAAAKPKEPGALEKAWKREKKVEESILDPWRGFLPKWAGGKDVRQGGVWGPNVAGPWMWKWMPKAHYTGPRAPGLLGPEAPGLGGEQPQPLPRRSGESFPSTFGQMGGGGLLASIGGAEGTGADYRTLIGYGRWAPAGTDITQMTLQEVQQLQHQMVAAGAPSGAVGRYQIIGQTMRGLIEQMHLDPNTTKFTPDVQNRMAQELLRRRGLSQFLSGEMSAPEFARRLSREWASFPDPATGRSFYGQRTGISLQQEYALLQKMRREAGQHGGAQTPPSLPRSAEEPGAAEAMRRMLEQYRHQHPGYETPQIETPRRTVPTQTIQASTRLTTPKRRTPIVEVRNQTGGAAYISASQLAI